MDPIILFIHDLFNKRGGDPYGAEEVTQVQHALQCGLLANEANASPALVSAALLHDIGHILSKDPLLDSSNENFDDKHELRANGWLKQHFGPEVADPVRLHVPAKRYLCTVDTRYESILSPTSRQSFYDQGGPMNGAERAAFEREPFFNEALEMRKWDDLAKDAARTTPQLEAFNEILEQSLEARGQDGSL